MAGARDLEQLGVQSDQGRSVVKWASYFVSLCNKKTQAPGDDTEEPDDTVSRSAPVDA